MSSPDLADDELSTVQQVREALRNRLSPAEFGLRFRPVREEGLRAATGATDFAGLTVF